MNSSNRRNGFSIVEIVLLVVVVAVIGFLGFTFYKNQQEDHTANNDDASSQSTEASGVQAAPAISSTEDLDKAVQTLDGTDVESGSSSDVSQIDSQSSDF